jgi:hypothetical protein
VVHSHLEEDIVEVIEVAVEDIRRIESRSWLTGLVIFKPTSWNLVDTA